GFGFLKNPPQIEELKKIYQDDYHDYISDADAQADAQKKFRLVKPFFSKTSRLLDYGCGLGHFLGLARKVSKLVYGYDISTSAAVKATKRFNVKVKSGEPNRQLFSKNTFDTVTCFDVIEHIPHFEETMKWFYFWLKPGGRLFITTPSLDSWDARLLKDRWYGFTRIPQHVIYFTKPSLRRALTEAGFRVENIQQWGFVRSVGYLTGQAWPNSGLKRLIDGSFLGGIELYLPMTDVLVRARK
ncbi:MAG: class I SAM-dependent methyltransferase, partial [Candidatus Chisholmbacteria bacterium]|nr:class I SAM-dependent methyltransferase [Candidatus Chisholmbacteria bacterium]